MNIYKYNPYKLLDNNYPQYVQLLAADHLVKIFSYLEITSLVKASYACREWKRIIGFLPIWNNIFVHKKKDFPSYNLDLAIKAFVNSVDNGPQNLALRYEQCNFNLYTVQKVKKYGQKNKSLISCIAVYRNHLVSASSDRFALRNSKLRFYDLNKFNNEKSKSLKIEEALSQITLCNDGNFIFGTTEDFDTELGNLYYVNCHNEEPEYRYLSGHHDAKVMSITSENFDFCSGDCKGQVIQWDIGLLKSSGGFALFEREIKSLSLCNNALAFLSSSNYGNEMVSLWDMRSNHVETLFNAPSAHLINMDDRIIATAGKGINLFDLRYQRSPFYLYITDHLQSAITVNKDYCLTVEDNRVLVYEMLYGTCPLSYTQNKVEYLNQSTFAVQKTGDYTIAFVTAIGSQMQYYSS